MANESTFIGHTNCETCGSKDNVAVYDDGHSFCFGCSTVKRGNNDISTPIINTASPAHLDRDAAARSGGTPIEYRIQAIPNRGITEETCRLYDYGIGEYSGDPCHVANYYDLKGNLTGQKTRRSDKRFSFALGNAPCFFGAHLWPTGGRKLTITEGEIDCLSVSQAFGNKYPCVSLANGAQSALKSIKQNYEWLNLWDEIVLMFDMDTPGRKAAEEAAMSLPMGKVKIANLPRKDANECLVAGEPGEITKAFWDAKPFRPDGIVSISDIKSELFNPITLGASWPWGALTELTFGRKPGQVFLFGAGVGVGKTDCFTECINHDINTLGVPVGVIYLEQPVDETVRRIAGKLKSKMFHVPDNSWTDVEYREAVEELEKTNKLWLYRHFGAMDWPSIKLKIEYFAKALDIKHIYIDHLTALVANEDDERRALDAIMAQMASMAQEMGLIIHVISHLTTPDGKPHEEGGRVMEKHFTGSRAIARWAHYMFGLERNKQAEDLAERSTTTFRVLKDRFTGRATGKTFPLVYNETTGRLLESVF